MPHDFPYNDFMGQKKRGRLRAALKTLYDAGARFIICNGKQPDTRYYRKKDQFKVRPSVTDALEHVASNGNIGIEPISLGCVAVDIDGMKTPGSQRHDDVVAHNTELASDVLAFLGKRGHIGTYLSLSGAISGKQHAWYRAPEKALGEDSEGAIRKAARLKFRPKDKHSGLDLQYRRVYVVAPYFEDLAEDWAEATERTSKRLRKLAGIRPAVATQLPADRESVNWRDLMESGRELPDPGLLRQRNARYLEKCEMPPEGEGQYNVARDLGFKAGQESSFNPDFADQAWDWLIQAQCRSERLPVFKTSFKDGQKKPVSLEAFLDANRDLKGVRIHLESFEESERIREAHAKMKWQFRYDQVLNTIEWRDGDAKWAPFENDHAKALWADAHSIFTCERIDKRSKEPRKEIVPWSPKPGLFDAALVAASMKRPVDPIADFIRSIPEFNEEWGDPCWDLFAQFGVEDNPLNRWASRMIWAGAYYFNSRDHYDPIRPVVILAGAEAIGKSAVIRNMIPKEYRARLHGPKYDPSDSEKQKVESVVGKILVEMGEMQKHGVKTLDTHKEFSQRPVDSNVRLAYRRNTSPIKRTAWMVGTANQINCLPVDNTMGVANTRFLPVLCGSALGVEKYLDAVSGGVSNRMKIWAHVKHWVETTLKERENLHMPDELLEARAQLNAKRAYVPDTLEYIVSGLTYELDNREDAESKIRRKKGYRIAELMDTETFVEKYMGGNSDHSRHPHLYKTIGPALTASGLWDKKELHYGNRWFRTNKKLPKDAAEASAKGE